MKMNQTGVSLVEVLAVLVLTSIVLLLSWSIFFQGTNYSNKSITKSHMQQDANYIVTKLKKIHQTSDSYTLELDSCSFIISYITTDNGEQVEEFKNNNLCIELVLPDIPPNEDDGTIDIEPTKKNLIHFTLTIKGMKDLTDKTKQVQINSSLHRLI